MRSTTQKGSQVNQAQDSTILVQYRKNKHTKIRMHDTYRVANIPKKCNRQEQGNRSRVNMFYLVTWIDLYKRGAEKLWIFY